MGQLHKLTKDDIYDWTERTPEQSYTEEKLIEMIKEKGQVDYKDVLAKLREIPRPNRHKQ